MLVENTALLKGAKRSQIAESKHKKIPPEDDRDCQPSKKTKEKQPARYNKDNGVKIGVLTPVRDVYTRQSCLVHNLR